MLAFLEHVTAEDIYEAAEIAFDPDVESCSFASKLEKFLDDRSKLNYADAVSHENGFDDKQAKIVEEFGSYYTEYADLAAVMINCDNMEITYLTLYFQMMAKACALLVNRHSSYQALIPMTFLNEYSVAMKSLLRESGNRLSGAGKSSVDRLRCEFTRLVQGEARKNEEDNLLCLSIF